MHFCYVADEIKQEFDRKVNSRYGMLTPEWVSKWAKEDFCLAVKDKYDLESLRQLIKNMYAKKYPELFIGSKKDRQGWSRVWYTEKMQKEMDKLGESM